MYFYLFSRLLRSPQFQKCIGAKEGDAGRDFSGRVYMDQCHLSLLAFPFLTTQMLR